MSQDGKNDPGKAGAVGPTGKRVGDNETTADALSQAGFKPAKVNRRIVSQGKRRETLRKQAPKDSG